MNIFKKLFGGQKTTEEVKQEKEKDFDMVKYDGVRALRMHQFDLAAKSLEHALQLNAEDLECRDYLSQAYISMGDLQKAYEQLQILSEAQTDNVAVLLRMADVAYMMENYTAMSEVCIFAKTKKEKMTIDNTQLAEQLRMIKRSLRGAWRDEGVAERSGG